MIFLYKVMSKQHKRIVLELKELIEDPPFNCSAGPINDEDMTKMGRFYYRTRRNSI